MNDDDPKSLGDLLFELPAVNRVKKGQHAEPCSPGLIEAIETDQDNDARLSFQHTVFCQAGLPYRNPGDEGNG